MKVTMKMHEKRQLKDSKKQVKKRKFKKKMPKSSSSNPQTQKFREAAKAKKSTLARFGFMNPSSGTGIGISSIGRNSLPTGNSLTLEALEKHNAAVGGFTESGMEDDATTLGPKTFNTWATNMTGCTNVTFNRVHTYFNSNSSLHKEILAVLAAITEVINEQGGKGSDVQYFACLVSSLQEADKMETIAAMVQLLSIVIKKVPVGVLQKEYSQVTKTLVGIITQCAKNKEMVGPLKPVMSCLSSVLRVIDPSVWLEASTEHVYKALLLFISHSKPKLRKQAQKSVRIILHGSLMMQREESSRPPYHPAALLTSQWCLDTIQSSKGNRVEILHILSLLKHVLGAFPHKQVKSCCEVMLKLMTLADPVIRSSCMEVICRLFGSKPDAKIVPGDMNAQIIMALYDHQPSEKDGQPMGAWLRVMEAAACNLSRVDQGLCISHLPRLFTIGMTCLLSDMHEVTTVAVDTMKVLLQKCVKPYSESVTTAGDSSQVSASNQAMTAIQKMVKSVESGLSYQFHSVWPQVLQLWSEMFLVVGPLAPKLVAKCLVSMGDLRDTPHFAYKAEMDLAVGSAVKALGPQKVLECIPLGISGENDNPEFPRGWLLPVLVNHVTHTQLGFFTSYFLPLAATFKKKSAEMSTQGRRVESSAYHVLQSQIWSMLKGFCDHPVDLKQSFSSIAKTLGTALNEREDLRLDILKAIRSLINCSLDKEDDKREVGRFAKNFLPILFNMFTEGTVDKGTRAAVLETIKLYFMVTDGQLISTFLDKSLQKINAEEIGSFRNIALLDMCMAMIPYIGLADLKRMFDLALPRLQSDDRTVQKKSYRVLEELCKVNTEASKELIASNMDNIRITLLQSLSKSSPSSKAPRLRCLMHVYRALESENMDFFMATLPEAILCTMSVGVKAKTAAYELIVLMSETYIKWKADSEGDALAQFITKLQAGLVGSPNMVSATLLAMTRVVYQYRSRLTGSILDYMIDNVCLLLATKTREIIKSALSFVKVLIQAFENTILAAHLKDLLNGLHDTSVKGNNTTAIRRLNKIIYTKLIKKFGYELIKNMTKPDVHVLLKNIYKTEERAKRKNSKDNEEEEESDEEEEQTGGEPDSIEDLLRDTDSELEDDDMQGGGLAKRKKKVAKRRGAWLMEKGDDEIVDFMDPSAAKQVVTTRPKEMGAKTKDKKEKDRGFKMTADGRLIITQDDEEDDKSKSKGRAQAKDSDDDDLDDLFAAYDGSALRNKSRKRKSQKDDYEDDDDDDDEAGPSSSKYRAGGAGIHRPIAKASRGRAESVAGSEYTSKKAHGDMKKKGKPDPYAYVPLNMANLNKRKQMKVKGTFNNLVKGAQKGAIKGSKGRAVNNKGHKGGKGKGKKK